MNSKAKRALASYNKLPVTATPADFLKGYGNWGLEEKEFEKAAKLAKIVVAGDTQQILNEATHQAFNSVPESIRNTLTKAMQTEYLAKISGALAPILREIVEI